MAQSELRFDPLQLPTTAIVRRQSSASAPSAADPVASPPPLLLSVSEVADRLGCGRTLVYELIGAGALEAVKLGRLRRVPTAALEDLVDRLRATARNV
jgi:excisionase family DNA binding protein